MHLQSFHQGGDTNVTDSDGDTPLFAVESIEAAKWLIDHGAQIQRVNTEGVSVRLLLIFFVVFSQFFSAYTTSG